jgi:hypothetical protein
VYQVAIDCPGYGHSPGDKQTVRSYPGDFLAGVVHALGRKSAAAMIGSSQGSASVMNAAFQKPRLAHVLALVHPVTHAPDKFANMKQPVLMIYDSDDPGHPVHVGRRLRKVVPNALYFEFSSDAHGSWDAQQLPLQLTALLQSHLETSPKKKRSQQMGLPSDKLPELWRVAGGLRSWTERHGGEIDPFSSDSDTAMPLPSDVGCSSDKEEPTTFTHSVLPTKIRKEPLFEDHNCDGSDSEDEDEQTARLCKEAEANARRESEQEACDLCGDMLVHPVRLAGCRCALCGPCVERWVRYMRDCPVCSAVMKRDKGTAFPRVDCDDLKEMVERRLEALSLENANDADGRCKRAAQRQCDRYLQCLHERETCRRVVLEYGNTVTKSGKKLTFDTSVRVVDVANLKGVKKDAAIRKVAFNINPAYDKPTKVVTAPDPKGRFVFAYSMGRTFPCVVTVHFHEAVGVAPLEIDFYVQNQACKQRVVLDLPTTGKTKWPSKTVVEFACGDPPVSAWLKYSSAVSANALNLPAISPT